MNKQVSALEKQREALVSVKNLITKEIYQLNRLRLAAQRAEANANLEKILSIIKEDNLEFEDCVSIKNGKKTKGYSFRCCAGRDREVSFAKISVLLPEPPSGLDRFQVTRKKWKGRPYELRINYSYNRAGEFSISYRCRLPTQFFMQTVDEHMKKSGFKIKNM